MSNVKVNKLESMLFKGKAYSTTAQRISYFRKEFDLWSIETDLIKYDDKVAIVKATIKDDSGRVLSTGMAKEFLLSAEDAKAEAYAVAKGKAKGYNKKFDAKKFDAEYDFDKPVFAVNVTSHLENAETGAIGRALAFLGIGIEGASIASYEEAVNATAQNEAKQALVETKPLTINKADGDAFSDLVKTEANKIEEKTIEVGVYGNSAFNSKDLLKSEGFKYDVTDKGWKINIPSSSEKPLKEWLLKDVFANNKEIAAKDCKTVK